VPLTTKQLRKHLAQAEQHIAESKAHVARQRQIVRELPPDNPLRGEAGEMLAILEGSLSILERHRELIRKLARREGRVTRRPRQRRGGALQRKTDQ